MAYNITTTAGVLLGTIADGTLNTSATSLSLVGRNYPNYGQVMTDNLVHLLENFANTNTTPGTDGPPVNPIPGQLYFDLTNKKLLVRADANTWKPVNGATAQSTAPSSQVPGDLWWDTINEQLYAGNGSTWILIGPGSPKGKKSGAIYEQITDTLSNSHDVVSLYLDNVRIEIISKDTAFTPLPTLTGFSIVSPGLNANTSVGNGTLWATANNASYLNGYSSSQFFKTTGNNSGTGTLSIVNNNGIAIGTSGDLTLSVDASHNAYITNNNNSQIIGMYVNSKYITINGSTGAIEVSNDPSTLQGVATKNYVDNKFTNTNLLGVPTATTAAPGTNTTQLATTAFVYTANVTLKSYVDGQIALKAPLASPALTGTPTAPTPAAGDNDTSIATTAFVTTANVGMKAYVDSVSALKAPLASPALTGTPTAPTPDAGDNDTSIATTAFVATANVTLASYVDGKYAPINNAALTGTPVAPTAPAGTNSTQLATTAFVSSANLTMKGYVDGITGSLLDGLNLKANIASPSLTGVPQSITMPLTTANTSIATTQFVQNAVNEVVANLNAFTTNIIQQGNSKMEILDSGSGSANLAIDGINVLTATSSGVILRNGATAVTQLQTDNSTSVATTAYVRLAAKRWDGSAKFVSTDAPNPGINDVGSIDGDFWFQREA